MAVPIGVTKLAGEGEDEDRVWGGGGGGGWVQYNSLCGQMHVTSNNLVDLNCYRQLSRKHVNTGRKRLPQTTR